MNRTALVLICTMLYKSQNNKIVSRLLEPLVARPQYLTAVVSFIICSFCSLPISFSHRSPQAQQYYLKKSPVLPEFGPSKVFFMVNLARKPKKYGSPCFWQSKSKHESVQWLNTACNMDNKMLYSWYIQVNVYLYVMLYVWIFTFTI